jgi:hypothetical protein
MQRRGKVIFRKNESADVFFSSIMDGWGRVSNATGHPHWHPIVVEHPGPFTLELETGQKAQIVFRNLQGLVQLTEIFSENPCVN